MAREHPVPRTVPWARGNQQLPAQVGTEKGVGMEEGLRMEWELGMEKGLGMGIPVGVRVGMEPGDPSPPHILVPLPRVVTDECYPFTSQESQPVAQPCMMHSRSTGRGKRQATARCPNPQTHANDIYQSTPPYRLSSSVSARGPGLGRAEPPARAKHELFGAGSGKGLGLGWFSWESHVWKGSWEKPAAERPGELLLQLASPQHPPAGARAASACTSAG